MISYAILVNDELKEIETLTKKILQFIKPDDEMVILQDIAEGEGLTADKLNVFRYLTKLADSNKKQVTFHHHGLNNNFAKQKNYLNSLCLQPYIFNIDADEIPESYLITSVHDIISQYPNVDAFWVSRVNTVEGITQDDITRWRWSVNEQGWINFPDPQLRIYKNTAAIKWKRPVHEYLTGYETYSHLPKEKEWSLIHNKQIDKQRSQNEKYEKIMRKEL